MSEMTTQEERLAYLVEAFKEDSDQYKSIKTPDDTEGKQRILRSLMNIRPPRRMPMRVLKIQDAYLKARIEEMGAVGLEDIPTVKESLHSRHPYAGKLSVWQGDITQLALDAIVNAANSQMLGCFIPMHTCIDNCIHTYAGVQLREECARNMQKLRLLHGDDYEQPTALPMLTDAYNLPAKKVIHIVGPIVDGPLMPQHEWALSDCYRHTLDMCLNNNLKSVAFCCISTGVFHFPNERAAQIAVGAVTEWLTEHPEAMDRVVFNVFKDEDRKYYEQLLR